MQVLREKVSFFFLKQTSKKEVIVIDAISKEEVTIIEQDSQRSYCSYSLCYTSAKTNTRRHKRCSQIHQSPSSFLFNNGISSHLLPNNLLMEIVEVLPEPDPVTHVVPPESSVYVAVGKAKSSMDALRWALRNEAGPSSVVFLVHVFPEVREIPTPLGNLAKSTVSPEQLESHMIRVRATRRQLLDKYINLCNSSRVGVDTILIESDQIAEAILDLIPVMAIPRLIIGASKSSLRKLRKGAGGKEELIVKSAPDSCEVKIICEGNQVSATDPASSSVSSLPRRSPSPPLVSPNTPLSPSPTTPGNGEDKKNYGKSSDEKKDTVKCLCF